MKKLKFGPFTVILTVTKTDWLLLILFLIFSFFVLLMSGGFEFNRRARTADRIRIEHLQFIQSKLELYYSENNCFPTSLSQLTYLIKREVPKDPITQKDYLYAFYPESRPTRYHLGAILETKNKILKEDADFNSKAAGYTNGFDGKDPVYDIHVIKK
jgi:type II secretory pathway pseudopilin PulG